MILKVINFINLFSKRQKTRLYLLMFFTLIANLFEIMNIFLIFEFVKMISSPESSSPLTLFIEKIDIIFLKKIIKDIELFGIFLISFLFLGVLTSTFLIYISSRFALITGSEISNKLLRYYLDKNYLFHLETSPSNIINKVKEQTSNVAVLILEQLVMMISKFFLIIPMLVGLFIYNPQITTIAGLLFISLYILIFHIFKKKFGFLGQKHTDLTKEKFEVLIDSLGGIKEIKINSKENYFLKSFKNINLELVNVGSKLAIFNRFPKFVIEFFALSFVVVLVIILSKSVKVNFEEIIILLSIFLISSYKILPALQQIYTNLSMIKSGIPSLEGIAEDFKESVKEKEIKNINIKLVEKYKIFKEISFDKITFSYLASKLPALENLSFKIKRGEKIGITGSSGSGKSTLIHLLSGLIKPSNGKIFVDDFLLEKNTYKEWRKNIGFVPQSIYLADRPLKQNIAFGEEDQNINLKRIDKVIEIANLDKLANNSKKDEENKTGYRGSKLSGGQMQRIGIARSIYNEPSILIFDEATSSLDNLTENEVLSAVNKLDSDLTLIMVTHKINLIKNFDKIIFLENGKISSFGKFDNIYNNSPNFKILVDLEKKDKLK